MTAALMDRSRRRARLASPRLAAGRAIGHAVPVLEGLGKGTEVTMAVLAECLSVIVPVRVLEDRFPGGLAGYAEAAPGRTFCHDGALSRVGFLTPDGVTAWIDLLECHGLVFLEKDCCVDIAVVDQYEGPTRPCNWLVFATSFARGISWVASRLEDASHCEVVCPAGWTEPKPGDFSFIPTGELADRAEVLGEDADALTIRDRRTGRVAHLPAGTDLPRS